jgi:polar amino acid transport system substrate-binding protein
MPPYQQQETTAGFSVLKGLDFELTRAIFQKASLKVNYEERAWVAQLESIRSGEQHFALAATQTDERNEFAHFSNPYRIEKDVLYVRRSELYNRSFEQVSDLTRPLQDGKFKLAVLNGFYYGEKVEAILSGPGIVSSNSDVENFKALIAGEVDGVLIDQLEGAYIARHFDWDSHVAEYPLIVNQAEIRVMFSKKAVNTETVESFNQALEKVVASGESGVLLEEYLESRLVSLLLGTTSRPWFYALDLLGTFAFALSGVLLARQYSYDIFGAFVLAALPAVGGGMVRDMIVGRHPIGILSDPVYLCLVVVTVGLGYAITRLRFRQEEMDTGRLRRFANSWTVQFLDAVGLSAFTVIGVLVAAEYHCTPLWLWGPLLAALTGAGGGILRDMLCQPGDIQSLRGSFYPEVAIVWGLLLSIALQWYGQSGEYRPSDLFYALVIALVGALATRLLALKRDWESPTF